jgi:hypothetical protein
MAGKPVDLGGWEDEGYFLKVSVLAGHLFVAEGWRTPEGKPSSACIVLTPEAIRWLRPLLDQALEQVA